MSASHHSRVMWVWVGFFVVAGFFLLTEHRAHAFGVLPYALLLACPVLHMLTHGRHTGGGSLWKEREVRKSKVAPAAQVVDVWQARLEAREWGCMGSAMRNHNVMRHLP